MKKYLPYFGGIAGAFGLIGIYWFIFSILVGMEGAWQQFWALQPWMGILVAGFGIQVGLFTYAHQFQQAMNEARGTGTVAATGGISSGSMVACCVHHLTDVFPLLGLAAVSAFLTRYQTFFLGIGVAANSIGIVLMLRMMQRYQFYDQKGVVATVLRVDMNLVFYVVLIAAMVGLLGWMGYLLIQ